MNNIIKYDVNLLDSQGAWITPNGEIIYIDTLHENYAKKYCFGDAYDYLYQIKYLISNNEFQNWKAKNNFNGTREDINEYIDSKLTLEQLKILKKWNESFGSGYSDYLCGILGYDKVNTIAKSTIITTNPQPYIKYWNYYLMDWDIDVVPSIYYDTKEHNFNLYDRSLLYADKNYIILDELDEIKQKTLIKDRYKYFK